MANYNGSLAKDLTPYFIAILTAPTTTTGYYESKIGAGQLSHHVSPAPAVRYGGSTGKTAGSTLFNNIVIMPQNINTGIITQNVIYNATIWNAFHDSSHAIQSAATVDGIQATGLNTPLTLGPFQSQAFEYTVTMQGNIQINDLFTIVTDIYSVYTQFAGKRGVAFLYSPLDGYQESFYFANDIFTSFTGKETATPLMWREKYKFQYQLLASNLEYQQIISALKNDNPLQILHPIWFCFTQLTQAATTNNTVIYCDTSLMTPQAGDYVAIWTSPTNFEVKQVSSWTSNAITIATALFYNWPIGANVALCRVVTLTNGSYTYKSDDITQFQLAFEEV